MTMSTPISQILKLILITALLIITPLLSSSLRSAYLYLIANVLILLVGAEAGLLSFFTSPPTTKRPPSAAPPKPHSIIQDKAEKPASQQCIQKSHEEEEQQKKSPSMPSIFFIDQPEDRNADEFEGDEGEEIGGQELFQKAETFIGNFYKQLKMQREDSWKKLHDFYHKPF